MSYLTLVKSENFGNVQCDFYSDNNQFWMTREQIGRALEYTDPMVAIGKIHDRHKERLGKHSFTNLVNGRKTYLYSPKGVYEICRWSQQPNADKFYDWVYELLEGLRTGKMSLFTVPKTFSEALLLAGSLQKQLEEQQPLVAFAEICAASKDSILIRELAKVASKNGLVTGERRLYRKLREWKMIFPNSTEPYQEYVDRGYFEVTQSAKDTTCGTRIFKTTRVTPKGQVYILDRLRREKEKIA
jgi:anti-repressor protein